MAQRHSTDVRAVDQPANNPILGIAGLRPPAWTEEALCAQVDPDAWFPEKGGSSREAKSVCARCTVAAECLDWALDNNEKFGIWGGVSERDRRRLTNLKDSA